MSSVFPMVVCLLPALASCGVSEAQAPAAPATKPAPVIAERAPGPASTGPAVGPVVIELFTSQGCSSCPPADRLLAELDREPGVIALAFHVDYWNHLGWSDPFSSAAWSARQRAYARALGWGVYTPQLVVQGRTHVVGSHRRAVRRAIAAHAAAPAARLTASARLAGTDAAPKVHVEVDTDARDALVVIALRESGRQTDVAAGENGGRHLRNDAIVRRLATVRGGRGAVDLDIDTAWPAWRARGTPARAGALGVVAFVQDPGSLAILAAAETAIRGM